MSDDLKKVHVVERRPDETGARWLVWCPGCECCHGYDDKRWKFNGDMDRPTFEPSFLTRGGKYGPSFVCHSYLTDGKISFLSDSTHKFAGVTLDLEAF